MTTPASAEIVTGHEAMRLVDEVLRSDPNGEQQYYAVEVRLIPLTPLGKPAPGDLAVVVTGHAGFVNESDPFTAEHRIRWSRQHYDGSSYRVHVERRPANPSAVPITWS